MSFKKTILAVAAVGALTAATAVPAMALENTFNGLYKMKYFVSNFDNTTSTVYAPTAEGISANNYFEQRARLFYNAKANDDLKMVLAFEIDSIFGDRSQGTLVGLPASGNTTTAFRNTGGAIDTDAVNLETKWVHLDFNVPGAPVNVKVGTQAIKDSLKGILFDVDAAGIYTATKMGALQVNVGYFRGYEGLNGNNAGVGVNKLGVDNMDMAILEGKFAITKDFNVGAAYYGYYDYRDSARTLMDHTVGLSADAIVGPVALSGFIAGQVGSLRNTTNGVHSNLEAFAANAAAKMKVGPGTAKLAGLYTSGDKDSADTNNHAWQSLSYTVAGEQIDAAIPNNSTAGNTYNESGMMLLNRNAAAQGTTTDRSIAYTTNNRNQGMTGLFAGYDANLSPKLYANANAGVAFTSQKNASRPNVVGTTRKTTSMYLGTEVNLEAGYKLYPNLTASVQAAYVFLGDYYKNAGAGQTAGSAADPSNPYTTRLALTYVY